ncbi:MAG: ParB-like nuclease domain-containing protein [Chromatiaceae bacterium]|nr:ParB-like nuclease domain-containing protein [Chromatiaceae bacterium]
MLKTPTKKPLGSAGANETNVMKQQSHSIVLLELRSICTDQAIQQRQGILNNAIVADYAEDMRSGATFPPVVVFRDNDNYLLADGFHRLEAADEAGLKEIKAEIRKGTKRDAILFAVGANRDHGLRRTRADVRRAITTLVKDPEWGVESDRTIADLVGCSDKTVAAVRKDLGRCGNSATKDTDQEPATSENQLRNFRSCDDDAPGIPSVNILAEAVAGLNAIFKRDTAPPAPPPAPPPTAKRIGRDGKARAMPKPKAAPTPAPKTVNKGKASPALIAMQRAHAVKDALVMLERVEGDLLPDDAVTVLCNLRTALTRLELRFGRGYMEVLHSA